jgi:hypothetical protein
MALHDLINGDRMEMLKWVSERNVHVPLSDLAFMLDLVEDPLTDRMAALEDALYDYCVD